MNDQSTRVSWSDAEDLWRGWDPTSQDLLARAAYDRTVQAVFEISEEGLYFRPGGWTVDVPAVVARLACAAGLLAAGFQVAGLEDLDREIIIAMAGLVSAMNIRPAKLDGDQRYILDRLQSRGLDGESLTPEQVRRALPKAVRRQVTPGEIADALDQLVASGHADQERPGVYTVRAAGGEAWIRVSLG